jgi:hypothetical protein
MNTIKQSSTHAAAASSIRKELKAAFPHTRFSIRGKGYAGGNSITIEWDEGPEIAEVKGISGKYQLGYFNSSEDCYEISNRREDIPQVTFVFYGRGR